MPRRVVASLAEPGRRESQHGRPGRAVGIVAVEAVLENRRMVPEEGTALVGVTGVAGVVDRVLAKQRLGHSAVGIVAGRAGHLRVTIGDRALAYRHVAVALRLCLLDEMALTAGRELIWPRQEVVGG